jgi:uncharacterized protein YcbX
MIEIKEIHRYPVKGLSVERLPFAVLTPRESLPGDRAFLDIEDRPRLVEAPGHMFSDRAEKVISILNLASVRELGTRIGADVDPIRFRANILIDGLPEWEEFAWPGRHIKVGASTLEVIDPIRRCAATCVNPSTAMRDLKIPTFLVESYGHMNTGIYARVIAGGDIAAGDDVSVIQ